MRRALHPHRAPWATAPDISPGTDRLRSPPIRLGTVRQIEGRGRTVCQKPLQIGKRIAQTRLAACTDIRVGRRARL